MLKNLKIKLFLIIIILFSGTIRPIDLNYYFKHINSRDGLPHNAVNSVIQDKTGFIWFATENGLSRYDGYSFVNYSFSHDSDKRLSNSIINTIELDNSGTLWVGTNGGGLSRYDAEQEIFSEYYPEPEDTSDLGNRVFSIFEDNENTLWIGTMGNGLYSFNKESGKFLKHNLNCKKDPRNEEIIYRIAGYHPGYLLVGTSSGLYKYDIAKNSSVCFPNRINSEKSFSVRSIFTDSSGLIWIGSSVGVLHLDKKTEQVYLPENTILKKIKGHVVNVFHEDKFNRMWIGSWNGLYIIERARKGYSHLNAKSRSNFDLSSRFVTDIYEDKSGVIWISSLNGVDIYNINQAYFRYYDIGEILPEEKSPGLILSVFVDSDNKVWLGLFSGGLIKFDRDENCKSYYSLGPGKNSSISNNSIMDIQEDRNGTLYLATLGGGLSLFNKKTGDFVQYKNDPKNPYSISNDYVSSIHFLTSDDILIGTWWGLNIFKPSGGRFMKYFIDSDKKKDLPQTRIKTVSSDSQGRIWICTLGGGLYQFEKHTGKFLQYKLPDTKPGSLYSDFLFKAEEGDNGNLWVGSFGGLLNFDFESKTYSDYLKKSEFSSNTIWDILKDRRGNLWMSTSMGISKFSTVSGVVENLLTNEDVYLNFLTPNNGYVSRTGEMFFGGEGGFLSFFPDKIKKNISKPVISITSVSKYRKGEFKNISFSPLKEIILSYKDELITFEFSVFSFSNPHLNNYMYKLEGINEGWINLGNKNTVSFSNLPYNTYNLLLKGASSAGMWSNNTASIKFRIIPPFWATIFFKVLCFILLISILLYLHSTRLKRLKRRLSTESEMKKLFEKSKISKREKEIIFLLLKGKTSKQIEDELFISDGTVRNHVYNIYKKLKVKNRVEFFNIFKNIDQKMD